MDETENSRKCSQKIQNDIKMRISTKNIKCRPVEKAVETVNNGMNNSDEKANAFRYKFCKNRENRIFSYVFFDKRDMWQKTCFFLKKLINAVDKSARSGGVIPASFE